MIKNIILISFVYLSSFHLSCAPRIAPVEKPLALKDLIQETQVTVKAPWEAEWDNVLQRATKEGKLFAYATGGVVLVLSDVLMREFKKKFGIDIHITSGRGGEISQKLFAERRSGLFLADIYIGGAGTSINVLKPAGVMEPLEDILILPEVTDSNVWLNKVLPFVDKERRFLIHSLAFPSNITAINANLARAEDFQSYRVLLEPKWKGKILMNDPTISGGTGQGWFSVVLTLMGLDFMKALTLQEPTIIRDQRLQHEWLARGKFAVLAGGSANLIHEFTSAGAPITIIWPKEGGNLSGGSGNISVIKNAPHPYAAKLFVNWFLAQEGQRLFVEGMGGFVQSAREDISPELTLPPYRRIAGMKYVLKFTEEGQLQDEEDGKIAVRIFGPLVK